MCLSHTLPVPDLEKTTVCGAVLVVVVVGPALVVVGVVVVVVDRACLRVGATTLLTVWCGLLPFVVATMAMSTTTPATPIDAHLRFPLIGSRDAVPGRGTWTAG